MPCQDRPMQLCSSPMLPVLQHPSGGLPWSARSCFPENLRSPVAGSWHFCSLAFCMMPSGLSSTSICPWQHILDISAREPLCTYPGSVQVRAPVRTFGGAAHSAVPAAWGDSFCICDALCCCSRREADGHNTVTRPAKDVFSCRVQGLCCYRTPCVPGGPLPLATAVRCFAACQETAVTAANSAAKLLSMSGPANTACCSCKCCLSRVSWRKVQNCLSSR